MTLFLTPAGCKRKIQSLHRLCGSPPFTREAISNPDSQPFTPSTFHPFNKIDPSPDTTCHPQPFGIQSHKVHSSPVRTNIPQRGEEYNPLTPHPSPIQPKLPLTRPSGTLSRKGRGNNYFHPSLFTLHASNLSPVQLFNRSTIQQN